MRECIEESLITNSRGDVHRIRMYECTPKRGRPKYVVEQVRKGDHVSENQIFTFPLNHLGECWARQIYNDLVKDYTGWQEMRR